MGDETQAIQQVISRYHQAITDQDADAAINCIGTTYLRFGKMEDQWRAGFNNHGEWADQFRSGLPSDYTNSIEFMNTNVEENTAVVVTKETGSGGAGSWEDVTNLWFLAQQEGEWKIVGSGHFIFA